MAVIVSRWMTLLPVWLPELGFLSRFSKTEDEWRRYESFSSSALIADMPSRSICVFSREVQVHACVCKHPCENVLFLARLYFSLFCDLFHYSVQSSSFPEVAEHLDQLMSLSRRFSVPAEEWSITLSVSQQADRADCSHWTWVDYTHRMQRIHTQSVGLYTNYTGLRRK